MLKTVGGVIAAVLAIATTALLVVAVLPGLFGLEQAQVVVQLSAFRLLVAIVAACGALLCILTAILVRGSRRVLPSVLAIVLAAVSVTGAVVTANRGIDDQMVAGEATDLPDQVTVLAWNTLGDAVDPGTIAAIAVRESADVVSLPETSSDTAAVVAAAMTAAGRPMVAHSTDADAGGTSLLISTGLGEYAVRAPTATGPTAIERSETLIADPVLGRGPTLVAVHTTAPLPSRLGDWRAELADLAARCTDDADVIMAGDFNATLDHLTGLRGVGDLGACHDAASADAAAGLGTWPTELPAVLGAPIDHVMATPGWVTVSAHVLTDVDGTGSDHRPVVATLLPRTAS
ncbi:endonuclease/exonuclease/phosphatase family protein [Plantibacter sp. M259]|uniref:endonuclease/exonuclease/phosphatase family protein n=1 Tax=Plantibacter sp. M259 TaxID=2583822 RepID=UPI0011100483|nr:endonuclease/exonuclease/phosphatase family protein [Plantibacter sp. M259]